METQNSESNADDECDPLGPNCYYDKSKSFFDNISCDDSRYECCQCGRGFCTLKGVRSLTMEMFSVRQEDKRAVRRVGVPEVSRFNHSPDHFLFVACHVSRSPPLVSLAGSGGKHGRRSGG